MFQQSSQATASATKLDELRDRVLVQHRSYPVQGGAKLGFDVSTVGVDENLVGDIKEQAVVITFTTWALAASMYLETTWPT